MSDEEKVVLPPLLKDEQEVIVPQILNVQSGTPKWEVTQGSDGAFHMKIVSVPVDVEADSIRGEGNKTIELLTDMHGLTVVNDGHEEMAFTINSVRRTVMPDREVWTGKLYPPFQKIKIEATGPWRIDLIQTIGVAQAIADTTPPYPPTNFIATDVTKTSLTISWFPSDSSDVAVYELYRGNVLIMTTQGTSYSISGQEPGTEMTFFVRARDFSGNYSTPVRLDTSTLPKTDFEAPAEVTNLEATNITLTSALLTWTLSTSDDVEAYDIYRGNTLLGSVGPLTTQYPISGLNHSTTYSYTIRGRDADNNVSVGQSVTFMTLIPDTTAPENVTGLQASSVTDVAMTISWVASPSEDTVGYNVYLNGTKRNAGLVVDTTLVLSSLNPSTSYTIRVTAVDNSSNESTGTEITATTTAQLIAYDTFNGDDVQQVTAMESGHIWTKPTFFTYGRVDNQLAMTSANTGGAFWHRQPMTTTIQAKQFAIELTLIVSSSEIDSTKMDAVLLRRTGEGDVYITFRTQELGIVQRPIAGNLINIGQAFPGVSAGDTMRIEHYEDGRIIVYINGALKIERTNTEYMDVTSSTIGIGVDDMSARLDDFKVYSL